MPTYYEKHVFFCINQRGEGKQCCQNAGAHAMRDYMKERVKELQRHGKGKIRVNTSGCLGRCVEGPIVVIYPEAVWYTYHSQSDIDEIIERHLIHGEVVEHLLLTNE
ncbi:MAG: (2Fe-2S) ferredoxin domain-containing protein [Proteobacteria bacterium]|nr:(2Fe-2S) ferredoxin domain-containing protein [Pseudomonadota bacterium]